MKYAWMDEYLMNKTGVTKDLKEEWNWIRYMIGGKCLLRYAWMRQTRINLFI